MDLIDRKELIRQIQLQANRSSLGETTYRELSFGEVAGLIMDAPTVNAVRHGKWIWDSGYGYWECTNCNKYVDKTNDLTKGKTKYCPHCGAKMDGE